MKHKIQIYLSYWSPFYSRKYKAWEKAFKQRGIPWSCDGSSKGVLLYSDSVPDSEIGFIYRDIYSNL